MSVTTAKAAGVSHVVLASPPKPGVGVPAPILYAAHLAGADFVLALGGVQAVAAMKHGFFTGTGADILVGPGSGFVAEAKLQLSGPDCAIDLFAGPTEIGIIADADADPEVVAVDIVSQGEHGPTSPCWLVMTSEEVGRAVVKRVPEILEHLPEPNRSACRSAWTNYGEVIVASSREAAVRKSDEYAPEHLEVLCKEDTLEWWKDTLPTRRAARHTGGLSVHKFLKILTWQQQDTTVHDELGSAAAVISRMEGMEGHAWAADVRLAKFARDGEKRLQLLKRSRAEAAGTAFIFDGEKKFKAPKLSA